MSRLRLAQVADQRHGLSERAMLRAWQRWAGTAPLPEPWLGLQPLPPPLQFYLAALPIRRALSLWTTGPTRVEPAPSVKWTNSQHTANTIEQLEPALGHARIRVSSMWQEQFRLRRFGTAFSSFAGACTRCAAQNLLQHRMPCGTQQETECQTQARGQPGIIGLDPRTYNPYPPTPNAAMKADALPKVLIDLVYRCSGWTAQLRMCTSRLQSATSALALLSSVSETWSTARPVLLRSEG